MKRCPKCQQTFSDDISFCLMDGTPLGFVIDQPEEATVVRSSPFAPQAVSPQKTISPILACSVIALLGLIVIAGVGLWLVFGRKPSPSPTNAVNTASVANESNKDQEQINQQKANLQDQQSELEKEKQRLADERKTLEDKKKNPPVTVTPPPPQPVNQPTARINFHRGSMQETVSGSVFTRRSFVLRTRAGQYLASRVVSSNNCVVFSNGSPNISYTTIEGDSSLTLVNNCGGQVGFSLTVYIR